MEALSAAAGVAVAAIVGMVGWSVMQLRNGRNGQAELRGLMHSMRGELSSHLESNVRLLAEIKMLLDERLPKSEGS